MKTTSIVTSIYINSHKYVLRRHIFERRLANIKMSYIDLQTDKYPMKLPSISLITCQDYQVICCNGAVGIVNNNIVDLIHKPRPTPFSLSSICNTTPPPIFHDQQPLCPSPP